MAQKEFPELDLKYAFLFEAALEDQETCQLVLELIMGRPVGPVKVAVEHNLLFSKDFRYVRFDVYASDEMKVFYDVEMQNSHRGKSPSPPFGGKVRKNCRREPDFIRLRWMQPI